MLLEFKVANHKSIAREQTLSLLAHSHRDLREQNTLPVPGKPAVRAVKAVAIYGPNGGGKSSVIEAALLMQQMALNSTFYQQFEQGLPARPFLLDPKTRRAPTSLEATFVIGGVRYRYGFSFTAERIEAEWLSAWPKGREQLWFEREAPDTWSFGREFASEGTRAIRKATSQKALFLTTAAALNHPKAIAVRNWFSESLFVLVPNLGLWPMPFVSGENQVLQYTLMRSEAEVDFKAAVESFLQTADLGVRGFTIESMPPPKALLDQLPSEQRAFVPSTKQVLTDHLAFGGETVRLRLEDESLGTRQFFNLAGPWVDTLRRGHTVLVDEILVPLHPLLIRHLMATIQQANTGAQLVLTTHDTNLLDPAFLRRDQIYFVEKDENGESHLYSLLDYQPRKNQAIEKGYLAGRYGAIPFVSEFVPPYGETIQEKNSRQKSGRPQRRASARRLRGPKG